MSPDAVRELVDELRPRYRQASRPEKSRILDQVCEITGYHRKSANRLMLLRREEQPKKPHGRRPVYRGGELMSALLLLWEASGFVCSKYLKVALPFLMAKLEQKSGILYGRKLASLLNAISASTIDRLLRPHRQKRVGQRYISNRQASSLRNKIALHTFRELRELPVGYAEIDLVFHCGMTLKDFHLTTLVAVETSSSWTICTPVWGKGKERVQGAVARLKRDAPYTLKGIFTDNGSEFINDSLYQYTQPEQLEFSHSRPYEKNDQPRVEQRNGSLVRRLIGYARYTSKEAFNQMEEVYRLACLQANFIRPVSKLLSVERHGARKAKHDDEPQAPFHRLLASEDLDDAQKDLLRQQYEIIDPLAVQRDLTAAIDTLWTMEAIDPASERYRRLQRAVQAERAR